MRNNEGRKDNTTRKCGRRKRATQSREALKAKIYSINDEKFNYERLEILMNCLMWDHLNEEEKKEVENLVSKIQDLFHLPGEKLTFTTVLKHHIRTTDNKPIYVKQY